MKVAINTCYGGFELSDSAVKRLAEIKKCEANIVENSFNYTHDNRSDKDLVQVIEELGEKANGRCARIAIIEIPDDVKWHVGEYDGIEWIAENHRRWDTADNSSGMRG